MIGKTSGCIRVSHTGGAAVGVARLTLMPFSCSRSMTSSSQPNSYLPGSGSSEAQAKTPRETMLTPASRMSRTSSRQTEGSHCSGL